MEITQQLSKTLNLTDQQVTVTLQLLNDGCTIPFISRYRKNQTKGLDEVQVAAVKEGAEKLQEFLKRKEFIQKSITENSQMTEEIQSKIEKATELSQLEDIYLPFKPKKLSKGQKAIRQGLKPLALLLKQAEFDYEIDQQIESFVKGEVKSKKEAIDGAINILSEWIAHNEYVRERIRGQFERHAKLQSKVKRGKDADAQNYKDYFSFEQRLEYLAAHRTLAVLRGEKEGFLNVKIDVDLEKAIQNIERIVGRQYKDNSYKNQIFKEAYKRLLQPSFESEFKKVIKDKADEDSILVFAKNLRQLLLQSPLGGKRILAIDPGFKTGCKVVVLDENGSYKENRVIYPHPPQRKAQEAAQLLKNLVESYKVEAIAIGNGTAGIETEKFCRNLKFKFEVLIFSVNEAGASIYSASSIAREEFPNLDVTVRGAISIGRRLSDPLAELVKIEPKSIGVGQYQHDVNQVALKSKLTEVVESCVNHVGVDVNTASYPILSYISGMGGVLASNVVQYRNEHGPFKNRKELLKVPKMGAKTFEQAAGFLRVSDGTNPLDNTIIHPESYPLAKEIAKSLDSSIEGLIGQSIHLTDNQLGRLKEKYDEYTLDFVLSELQKPTRDPREPRKKSGFNDIRSISDIEVGMKLNGAVNNITNFGAFVSLGIKESGLIHITDVAEGYINDIHEYLHINQQVEVVVKSVDVERKRIGLKLIEEAN